mgnify:CR=1 FL=1
MYSCGNDRRRDQQWGGSLYSALCSSSSTQYLLNYCLFLLSSLVSRPFTHYLPTTPSVLECLVPWGNLHHNSTAFCTPLLPPPAQPPHRYLNIWVNSTLLHSYTFHGWDCCGNTFPICHLSSLLPLSVLSCLLIVMCVCVCVVWLTYSWGSSDIFPFVHTHTCSLWLTRHQQRGSVNGPFSAQLTLRVAHYLPSCQDLVGSVGLVAEHTWRYTLARSSVIAIDSVCSAPVEPERGRCLCLISSEMMACCAPISWRGLFLLHHHHLQ